MHRANARQAVAETIAPQSVSAESSQDLRELFAPLSGLLTSGGDDRIQLQPETRTNAYGCAPSPQAGIVECASSTATSISRRAYIHAEQARLALIERALTISLDAALDARIDEMRQQLIDLLGLQTAGAEIVFAPSGTDATLQAGFIAGQLLGASLVNVMVAADETGSGVSAAAMGHHFGHRTASGDSVAKGELIQGFPQYFEQIGIAARGRNGETLNLGTIDSRVIDAVEAATRRGQNVLLHAMDCSKTGLRLPSLACLDYIAARFSSSVQIVIDACQMRLSRARLQHYLARNFLVLVTGSKFFTGPPFSGALLVPSALSGAIAGVSHVPQGLHAYSAKSSWPGRWSGIRAQLPRQRNLGEWLRWEAALEEMRAYFAAPPAFRSFALNTFASVVGRTIESSVGLKSVGVSLPSLCDGIADEEMAAQTIFPFWVCRRGRPLPAASVLEIYRELNSEIAHLRGNSERGAHGYHLGQPVLLNCGGEKSGALRVSASARLVSECWDASNPEGSEQKLQSQLGLIAAALEKTAWLAARY